MIKNLVKEPIFENGMTVFNKGINAEIIKEIAREAKVLFFKEVYMRNPLDIITCSGSYISEEDIVDDIDSLMLEVDSRFKDFLEDSMSDEFNQTNFGCWIEDKLNQTYLYKETDDFGEEVSVHFNAEEAVISKNFKQIDEIIQSVLDTLVDKFVGVLVSNYGEFAQVNEIQDYFLEYLSRKEMRFFKEEIENSCLIKFNINKSYYTKLVIAYLVNKYKD